MSKNCMYLLRGSPELFADVRVVARASGTTMAAFIRLAVERALTEAKARSAGVPK